MCKERDELSSLMDIRQANNMGKYLRFSMKNHHPKIFDYQYIIDHMNKKLSVWKTRFLNLAGRTTLIKSVLATILVYIMQCNLFPQSTLNYTDHIQINFLWG